MHWYAIYRNRKVVLKRLMPAMAGLAAEGVMVWLSAGSGVGLG